MIPLHPRPLYTDSIRPFIGKPYVKVLAGIRRCGKSALLQLLADQIKATTPKPLVLHFNFESFLWGHISDATQLYDEVVTAMKTAGQTAGGATRTIVLLDEVQMISNWEAAVNSLMIDHDIDIYVTGSNSRMLSSELSTMLTGRYISFKVYTLSFAEYLDFHEKSDISNSDEIERLFYDYIKTGGFPILSTSAYSTEAAYKLITDIYSSVILRDVVQRHGIRNVDLLDRIVRFAFNNIGNRLNAKKIADYFKSQQRSVDTNTIYNYLDALVGAFILHRVPRYDIRGKALLSTNEKYYVSDSGLVYAMFGYQEYLISGILENIVFLELKRRGYDVYVGQTGDCEIDFVAVLREEKIYVQVAYKLESDETIQREFNILRRVPDQYPKYVLSMERHFPSNIDGIRHIYLPDFLRKDSRQH